MLQLFANTLIAASLYSAIALSFWMIYRSSGFFHLAHGAMFSFGAYACYFAVSHGVPLVCGAILGMGLSAGLGALMQAGVFKQLNQRGSKPLILLLASLGLYVVIENSLGMTFGYGPKSLRTGMVSEGSAILGARLTPAQLSLIGFALFAFFVTWLCLRFTRIGLKLRAVASDSELSEIVGLSTGNVSLGAMAIGSALVSLFGILFALDLDLSPGMGMQPLMLAIVTILIGGTRNVWGIAAAALALAAAQQCAAWWIGSQWQDMTAFVALTIFLLFKPEGFFGKKSEKAFV
jgi:branched-chain amino acid transport system permease protein